MQEPQISTSNSEYITGEDLKSMPVIGFILWAVKTRCWTIDDFHQHFGEEFPIVQYVEILRHRDLLLCLGGPYISLTKEGEQLVEDLVGEENLLQEATQLTPSTATKSASGSDGEVIHEVEVVDSDSSKEAFEQDWTQFLPDPRESPWNLNALLIPDTFIGRRDEVTWLEYHLTRGRAPVCALYGVEGIGKTSLAGVAARALLAQGSFTDGIATIWCDHAQTHGQPHAGHDILRQALGLLNPHGVYPASMDIGTLAALAREQLRGKDVLVILDHVDPDLRLGNRVSPKWRIDEVISALNTAGAALLLISTEKFPAEIVPAGAQRHIGPLAEHEDVDLFANELRHVDKSPLRTYEREAILKIVRALRYHTLAIKLISGFAAANRDSLIMLAEDLQQNPRPMLELEQNARPDPGADAPKPLEVVLEDTLLKGLSHAGRQLLTAFAAFATVEFSRNAALSLANVLGLSQLACTRGLNTLIQWAFVERDAIRQMSVEGDRDRLRLHTLLAEYATREFAQWSQGEQERARRAVATYYAQYVQKLQSTSLESTLAFDKGNLAGAIEWARESKEDGILLSLCFGMRGFWYNQWYTRECERYVVWGIEAGERLEAQSGSQEILKATTELEFTHAQVLRRLGKVDDAETKLEVNLRRRRKFADPKGIAATLGELAIIARIKGNLDYAAKYIDQSLILGRKADDRQSEAHSLSQLARIKIWQCDPVKAQDLLDQSLDFARNVGDRRTEAVDLVYLGQVARERGFLDVAEIHLKQARKMMHEIGNQRGEAVAFHQLGQLWRVRGDLAQAHRYFLKSLSIRRVIGDRRGEGEALGYLGRIARAQGNWDEADDLFKLSLAIANEVGDRRGEGIVLSQLGRIAWARGDIDQAVELFTRSLAIREEVHDLRGKGADLGYLGRIALQREDLDEARARLEESLRIARGVHDREGEGFVLVAHGMLMAIDGNLPEAQRLLHQALRIAKRIQAEPNKALFRWELGRFYTDFGDKPIYGRRLMREARRQLDQFGLRGEDIQGRVLLQ
jgi:tetratricopeptide (TPR) repeat protein